MPIFEYKCGDCGEAMEFLEKNSGTHRHRCIKCGGSRLDKLLSEFSVGRSRKSLPSCSICPGGEPGVDCQPDSYPCPCDMY